jgi:GNAT superfamily N-acetyltransferase
MVVLSPTTEFSEVPHIRALNPRRDLGQVADLIELCFSDNLDPDGKRYLQKMRQSAKNLRSRWLEATSLQFTTIPEGYVWEENDRIVGNISLIPFTSRGRSIYLIANVAVHPDFRRQGIARALTEAALNWTQRKRVSATWLQVRDDNLAALNLYQSAGFYECGRRTTWNILPGTITGQAPSGVRIVARRARHWKIYKQWLLQNYPLEFFWYWPVHLSAFQPGIWGTLVNFFNETQIRHWGVSYREKLVGFLSWKKTHTHADQLWLAASPENENLVLATLLPFIDWRERRQRPLSIDFPAGRAKTALEQAGFHADYTLVWMKIRH